MNRRKPLPRKKPMQRGAGPKQPPRKVRATYDLADNREVWIELRNALHARSGGRCERCGAPLGPPWARWEAHHRKLRSQGGQHVLSNLAALCTRCHHAEVHAQPVRARAEGWIVPRERRPERSGVLLHDGRLVLFDDEGGYV